jgi:hypothetical protein
MSTDYIPSRRIAFDRIKSFRHGKIHAEQMDADSVALTDGKNYLIAYAAGKGFRTYFSRSGANDPTAIVAALESFFQVRLISEYEEEFTQVAARERRRYRMRPKAREI